MPPRHDTRPAGALAAATAILCAYETVALTSGRLPSLSSLCRQHRWLEAGLLAALIVHFHHEASR